MWFCSGSVCPDNPARSWTLHPSSLQVWGSPSWHQSAAKYRARWVSLWRKSWLLSILIWVLNSNLIYFSLPTFNRFHLPDLKPKLPAIKTDKNKIVSQRPFPISSHHGGRNKTAQTAFTRRPPLKLNGPQSSMAEEMRPPPPSSANVPGQQSLSQRPRGSLSPCQAQKSAGCCLWSNSMFNEFN